MPGLEQWMLASVAFWIAANSFVSAFWFPDRDMRWHSRTWPPNRQIPMSIRGRIAFGSYFPYWGLGILFGHLANKVTLAIWLVGFFALQITVGVVHWRDKRNYEWYRKI
jgi:hypothetical protein